MLTMSGADGVPLAVQVDGPQDGRPVVLLHGWPDSHRLWRHQVPALNAAGMRTIALDLRGFGESGRPDAVEDYAVGKSVADVIAVLDHLGVDAARVVAHDWGAAVGWALAARQPDRVDRYVALSVGHPKAFRDAGFEQLMRSWYMLLFQFDGVAEPWLERLGGIFLSTHPDREEVLVGWRDRERLTAGLNWYRANAHPKAWLHDLPELPPVRCPVLGVWSSGDVALTEAQMKESGRYVAGSFRYERIEGAGHWMTLERPDVVTELLLDHLA